MSGGLPVEFNPSAQNFPSLSSKSLEVQSSRSFPCRTKIAFYCLRKVSHTANKPPITDNIIIAATETTILFRPKVSFRSYLKTESPSTQGYTYQLQAFSADTTGFISKV